VIYGRVFEGPNKSRKICSRHAAYERCLLGHEWLMPICKVARTSDNKCNGARRTLQDFSGRVEALPWPKEGEAVRLSFHRGFPKLHEFRFKL